MTQLERKASEISPQEREQLLDQFEKSGLTFQEFAREHNLNAQTLNNWVWRKKRPEARQYTPVERKKMVEAFLSSEITASEFGRIWDVAPSTLLTWVSRYEKHGSEGLMNSCAKKRDDKRVGIKTPQAIQEEIVEIKKKEPGFGLKRIKHWLYRDRGVKVSTGTIRKTMKRHGLSPAKRVLKRKKGTDRIRRFERAKPMQLWQSDITQFTIGQNSMRVYLTVFMDDHSRYIVGWRLQSRQTAELVLDAFKDATVKYGKPEEVLTDQGRQYFAWRGKSELEKLLEKEGIKHVVSRAHHPQTLGKCERFWETVGNEFWSRIRPLDLDEARERLGHFINHYNFQRPHQGLDGQVPADRFFGIAEEVRGIIEKTVAENSLRISIGELPKKPAFLIGQIGEQKIAFHGTSGNFYLTHENLKEDDNGKQSVSVKQYAIGTNEGGGAQKSDGESIPSGGDIAKEAKLSTNTSERALGSSDRGGAIEGERDCADVYGVLDREHYEVSGDNVTWDAADQILAANESSDCWIDSGIINPATERKS